MYIHSRYAPVGVTRFADLVTHSKAVWSGKDRVKGVSEAGWVRARGPQSLAHFGGKTHTHMHAYAQQPRGDYSLTHSLLSLSLSLRLSISLVWTDKNSTKTCCSYAKKRDRVRRGILPRLETMQRRFTRRQQGKVVVLAAPSSPHPHPRPVRPLPPQCCCFRAMHCVYPTHVRKTVVGGDVKGHVYHW